MVKDFSKYKYYDEIQKLRLIDDIFMTQFFKDCIPCTEFVLSIILNRNDLKVKSVKTQKIIKGLGKDRALSLDIFAEDEKGKGYNIEIQRADEGADKRRARFHSSIIDSISLKSGNKFSELCDNYVIFITENDVLKGGLPLYTINRYIEENGKIFDDGSHIIYVNGSDRNSSTALGKLMHDFFEPEPSKMFYTVLAERTKYFKETDKEIKKMDDFTIRMRNAGREEGRKEERENIVKTMLQKGKLALDEISEYTGISLRRVKAIAKSSGIVIHE